MWYSLRPRLLLQYSPTFWIAHISTGNLMWGGTVATCGWRNSSLTGMMSEVRSSMLFRMVLAGTSPHFRRCHNARMKRRGVEIRQWFRGSSVYEAICDVLILACKTLWMRNVAYLLWESDEDNVNINQGELVSDPKCRKQTLCNSILSLVGNIRL